MFNHYRILVLSLLTTLSCSHASSNAEDMSSSYKETVEEILVVMQQDIVTKQYVDWDEVRKNALYLLGESPNIEQRNKTIRYLLKATKTNHTFYRMTQSQRNITYIDLDCRQDISPLSDLPDGIGYVRINGFRTASKEKMREFAESIQAQIITQDSKELKGWIVDLRYNRGGNMWPMLAGISSLLEDGIQGYFVKPDGGETEWGTYKGASVLNNRFRVKLSAPHELKSKGKPIAVLSSKRTASSGEAILIALKGNSNTRFFGSHSCGQATANRPVKLKNGDLLLLTSSVMADKTGTLYGNRVEVDYKTDEPVNDAVTWISTARID